MSVICIGPVCIPLYSIVPFLLFLVQKIWTYFFPGQMTEVKLNLKSAEASTDVKSAPVVVKIESIDQWESFHHQSNQSGKPVVVDFTAEWCRPCKQIAPFFEQLSEKYGEQLFFVKVDVDAQDEIAAECKISAMPTFQVYVKSEKVEELKGNNPSGLEAMVQKHANLFKKSN